MLDRNIVWQTVVLDNGIVECCFHRGLPIPLYNRVPLYATTVVITLGIVAVSFMLLSFRETIPEGISTQLKE